MPSPASRFHWPQSESGLDGLGSSHYPMSLPHCRYHWENAKANPKVAIACSDFAGRQGYRLVGEAADERERLKDRIPLATRAKAVVLVRVNEVYGFAASRLARRFSNAAEGQDRRSTGVRRTPPQVRVGRCLTCADTDVVLASPRSGRPASGWPEHRSAGSGRPSP
jgi:hypothetical protein